MSVKRTARMTTYMPTTDPYPISFADAVVLPDPDPVIVDISHWQDGIKDVEKMVANAHGVILRAGSIDNVSGKCYVDHDFHENASKLEGRLPIGAYWYYRPNHDPLEQAGKFCEYMAPHGFGLNIPPVADVECNPNWDDKYDFARWLQKFLVRVEVLSGVRPMIYTRGYWWNNNLGNPAWAGDYELHIARYTNLPKPWGNGIAETDKFRPAPWDTWKLWQWSADGNMRGAEFGVGSNSIDVNRFNGTLSEFYRWCNWKQDVPEPPTPPVEPSGCCNAVLDKAIELLQGLKK